MSKKPKKPLEAFQLPIKKLEIYRRGFHDGNVSNYYPGGLDEALTIGAIAMARNTATERASRGRSRKLIKLAPPMGHKKRDQKVNTFCKVVIALLTIAQLAIFFTSHSVLIPFMTFWIWCALVVPFALVGMLFRPRDKVVVVQAPAPRRR